MAEIVNEETLQSAVADEPQAEGQEALSSVLNPTEPTADAQELSEVPKALRGRIKGAESRGYERGKREVEEQYRQDLEELANLRLERDAKELAEQEKISVSMATRLLRAERGVSAPQKEAHNSVEERAQVLYNQANTIKNVTGIDVLEMFNNDQDIHQKVVSGEWDFTDVAKSYKQHVPAPVRSTGQTGIEGRSIANMSDEEFEKFDKLLDDHSFDARL